MQNIIIAIVVALAIGFGGGMYVEKRFNKADQVEQLQKGQKDTAQGIGKALETDKKVEGEVLDAAKSISDIRKAAAKRVKPKEIQSEKTTASKPTVCSWSLDLGTVSLLSAAREGSTVDPAWLGHAASKAPSAVSPADLVDSDIEVAGLYRELAIRHDALVSFVEDEVKLQAK